MPRSITSSGLVNALMVDAGYIIDLNAKIFASNSPLIQQPGVVIPEQPAVEDPTLPSRCRQPLVNANVNFRPVSDLLFKFQSSLPIQSGENVPALSIKLQDLLVILPETAPMRHGHERGAEFLSCLIHDLLDF